MGETFGALLARHRAAAGLSQTVLASMADCDWTYIPKLERGIRQPSRIAVLAFATALELDISQTDRFLYAAGYAPLTDYQALYEAEHGPHETRTKWCLRCQQDVSIKQFSTDRSRKDGLFPYCRSCKSAKWTAYATRIALRGRARRAS